MNKERYDGLSAAHRKIIDELSGKTMSDQGSATFDGADQRSEAMMKKSPKMKKVNWVQVSPSERAKMDAAVKKGLESIFADYAKRGIKNAREIYNALNQ